MKQHYPKIFYMKNQYAFIIAFFLAIFSTKAQVTPTGNWAQIGNANLSIVYNDADNGDDVGDGAVLVDGQSAVVGQGVTFTFEGKMTNGQAISISTYTYNQRASYVKFKIELYNQTDNRVLKTTTSDITINGNDPTPVLTTLTYTAQSNDANDVLQARYIRTDDGNTARDFNIDNLKLNGTFVPLNLAPPSGACPFTVTPDLPLIASDGTIEAEITTVVNRFSDDYLGTSAPTAGQMTTANNAYAALNINVSGSTITGNPITNFNTLTFLKTFAQQLKFHPEDTSTKTKANRAVWLTSKYFCEGSLPLNDQLYDYQKFARPTTLMKDFLDPVVKDLFGYTLYMHSVQFEHYWVANYDVNYQAANGTIVTDVIYNISDVLLAYSLWQKTDKDRYRYMRAYKRYMDRFFSHTPGASEGIKVDGTGFHHRTAYNNYMYAYNTAASILSYLEGTRFQVEQDNYKVFREAFYTQYIQANDSGVQGFATSGRNPQSRTNTLSKSALKTLAIAGGSILGLSTADPVLAGLYNRLYGVDPAFGYSEVTPFEEGFSQYNYAHAGSYRKNNWVAFTKGFSDYMWGSEIYVPQNRYGRYQSYGTLEIIYPGDRLTGNGYDVDTWDWNYNPGTTVIRLPWDKLHAERGRIDELQQKRFVGALTFKHKESTALSSNFGNYGLFAMDFREKTGQGFGVVHSGENHNNTFTFKKSNFFFDDIIVSLGSGISNSGSAGPTITTLYQRRDNSGNNPIVNGTAQSSMGEVSYGSGTNNWLISNYSTGFYVPAGSGYNIKVKKEAQKNPNQDQIWPVDYSGNPTATYYTGYLDHGTNPSNKGYEYIVKPATTVGEMQALHTAVQGGNKPYVVHRKDATAHIVQYLPKNIWGYAFFGSASNLSYDYVKGVNGSCLLMTEYNSTDETILVALNNPDLGITFQSFNPSVVVEKRLTLNGEWHLVTSDPSVSIVSANASQTVVAFTTVDGAALEVLLQKGPETCSGGLTTYSGSSWSNGVPTATKKAVFTKDYNTSSGNINACSCEIKEGASVTVGAGKYMKIEGNISVNGKLFVDHEGSLVQVDDNALVLNNGSITVRKVTPTLAPRFFMIMGSPMTAETRTDVYGSSILVRNHLTGNFVPDPDVAAQFPLAENFADDNGDNFLDYSGTINAGEGYLVLPQPDLASSGSYTLDYKKGTLNNGEVLFNVLYNGTQNASPNVVGNPYASAINANLFLSENSMINAVYFWEHLTTAKSTYPGYKVNNYDMGDISMFNSSGGVKAANDPGNSTKPNGFISSGQGFGFKATAAGTAKFKNYMRVTDHNDTYRRPTAAKDRIWLQVDNETYGLSSGILISFSEDATDGYDAEFDAKRLATPVSLYSVLDTGEELAIQGRSAFNENQEVPLGFVSQVEETQEFKISISELDGIVWPEVQVYLLDRMLSVIHNLTDADYIFKSNEGTQKDRFVLLFKRTLDTPANELESISIVPNPTKGNLTIFSPKTVINSVEVYDIRGRRLMNIENNSTQYALDLSSFQTATYFVKINTQEGTLTKRVVKH